ncbi:MAG: hypothetical protein QGI83_05625 [Candidatus Latescibacteria bacterium]|nr:hypothetical protein [Candidatus Latescibacterota bacterium]
MSRVLVDARSHQAIRHLGTESIHYSEDDAAKWRGRRLKGLDAGLRDRNIELVFGDPSEAELAAASVLMLTGRSDSLPHTAAELQAVLGHHERGGPVFLMANHAGFVAPQRQIAEALGLAVQFEMVTRTDRRPRFVEAPFHETSHGCGEGLRIRTSCGMTVGDGFVVTVDDEDETIGSLAAARDRHGSTGRVMVTASGGHIASLDDSKTDLYASASNARWTMNIIAWLCDA